MLLFRTHTLASGLRVRVRLPQRGDATGLVALGASPLEARRLLRHDPRREAVVVVTTWIDGADRLVGYGGPDAVLADEDRAPGVTRVIEAALRERLTRVA
jgi:hypothetical protein